MPDFDPGPGWREVSSTDQSQGRDQIVLYPNGARIDQRRYWVRVEPMPPLPTEPRTSITVTYTTPERDLRELEYEDWVLLRNGLQWMSDSAEFTTADVLRGLITGFEVLAEPRQGRFIRDLQQEILDLGWRLSEALDHERAHGEKMKAIVRRETAKAVIEKIRKHGYVTPGYLDHVAREFEVES